MSPENSQRPYEKIQQISPASLRELTPRVSYLKSFLQFTDEDGAAIQASKPIIAPLLPAVLDIVYSHLLSYDITAKAFVPAQPGQEGGGSKNVQDLALDHPNIRHRQDFLKGYLVRMVSNSNWADDSKYWEYLDRVGLMHTGQQPFKHRQHRPELRVEYVHMGLLLGFVEDVVVKTVLDADLDAETKKVVIRAFNKVLWIQNDLFARHYTVDEDSGFAPTGIAAQKPNLNTPLYLTLAGASVAGLITGATIASQFVC